MRVANFSAGPAGLPLPVLEEAQTELLDYAKSGMSIMEQSHRGKVYEAVHEEAIALIRELAGVPADYHILFLQGGASQQFAIVPMNLLPAGKSADYVIGGHWGERALEEAKLVGQARVAGSSADSKHTRLPRLDLDAAAVYTHVTTNNTIEGTQMHRDPDLPGKVVVADMSSDFLSRRFDVGRYGLIYAGAQKNLGPSGVTCVIARRDLVEGARKDIPKIFRYATHASAGSLYHTPPTFAIYLVRGVLRWIQAQGGLAGIEARNDEKARRLYAAIDAAPDYWRCPIEREDRSKMNVVWRLPTEALDDRFCVLATAAGLVGLKGYRTVGGIRASLYNAVSVEDVDKLVGFMADFKAKNG
jgi:phosphoserine aminotransferase